MVILMTSTPLNGVIGRQGSTGVCHAHPSVTPLCHHVVNVRVFDTHKKEHANKIISSGYSELINVRRGPLSSILDDLTGVVLRAYI